MDKGILLEEAIGKLEFKDILIRVVLKRYTTLNNSLSNAKKSMKEAGLSKTQVASVSIKRNELYSLRDLGFLPSYEEIEDYNLRNIKNGKSMEEAVDMEKLNSELLLITKSKSTLPRSLREYLKSLYGEALTLQIQEELKTKSRTPSKPGRAKIKKVKE